MIRQNPACGCGEDLICNEAELQCDPCCRCVPLRLCATFRGYGCACDGNSDLPSLDENQEYVGAINCGSETIDLLVFLYFENRVCYWRVISETYYIDEVFEISPPGQSCEEPQLEFAVALSDCSGTVTIRRHEQERLPLRQTDDCQEELWCGSCECTCSALCVRIANGCDECKGEIAYDDYSSGCQPAEPSWSGSIACFGKSHELQIVLSRDEYTKRCVLGGTANGEVLDWVEVGDCTNLAAVWEFYDGTTISVECVVCDCESQNKCAEGCCFPIDYSHPLYPCGVIPAIPFSISAPGCDLDGVTGTFNSGGAKPVTNMGECGPACVQPAPVDLVGTIGKRVAAAMYNDCEFTPCSVQLSLELECDDDAAVPEGLDPCCGKLRLVVCTSEKLVGGDTGRPACHPDAHWKRFAPTSCVCLPNGGGFAAVFDVSLDVDCPEHWEGGPCDGQPKDCCIPFCGGFTLTI